MAEACTHALTLVHTLQHSPPEVTGSGRKREGAAWKGMTVETNNHHYHPPIPPVANPFLLAGLPPRPPPREARAGEALAPLGGVEPGRAGGPFGAREGAWRGRVRRVRPRESAPVPASGRSGRLMI